MSHGGEGDKVLGSDQRSIKLTEIYELLSPTNFPLMAGKPKILVIQACAGRKASHATMLRNGEVMLFEKLQWLGVAEIQS